MIIMCRVDDCFSTFFVIVLLWYVLFNPFRLGVTGLLWFLFRLVPSLQALKKNLACVDDSKHGCEDSRTNSSNQGSCRKRGSLDRLTIGRIHLRSENRHHVLLLSSNLLPICTLRTMLAGVMRQGLELQWKEREMGLLEAVIRKMTTRMIRLGSRGWRGGRGNRAVTIDDMCGTHRSAIIVLIPPIWSRVSATRLLS